jgi:hypothetical protein
LCLESARHTASLGQRLSEVPVVRLRFSILSVPQSFSADITPSPITGN